MPSRDLVLCFHYLLLLLCLTSASRPVRLLSLDSEETPDAKGLLFRDFQPGDPGVHLEARTGRINQVVPGGQAQSLGLIPGQYIVEVEGKTYSFWRYTRVLAKATKSGTSWRAAIHDRSEKFEKLAQYLDYMYVVAGVSGFLVIFALPLAIDGSRFPRLDIHPFLLHLALGGAALLCFGWCGRSLLEWEFMGFVSRLQDIALALRFVGILWGCLAIQSNSLLQTSLGKTMAAKLKVHEILQWLLFSLSVAFRCVGSFALAGTPGVKNLGHHLQICAWLPVYCSMLFFGLCMSRVAIAARQQMADVMEALPCDQAQFAERVREPCAKVLAETNSELSQCGIPLVFLAGGAVFTAARFYDGCYHFIVDQMSMHARIARAASVSQNLFQLVACVWVVSIGPIQLAHAAKRLDQKLRDSLCHDTGLDVEVRIVQDELAKARSSQIVCNCACFVNLWNMVFAGIKIMLLLSCGSLFRDHPRPVCCQKMKTSR